MIRLGVNIDHVATVRNARGGTHPNPVSAALAVVGHGADGITAHLREDRRHIRDRDIFRLKAEVPLPLNFEMAATEEMLGIALKVKPNACCLVPEKRQELTTEGGLDAAGQIGRLRVFCSKLRDANIRISLFVDADAKQIEAAKEIGADIVEIHTGKYCELAGADQLQERKRIIKAAQQAHHLGIECHAGHGLSYDTVGLIAAIPEIVELNIGHFLMGQAMFEGLPAAVKKMKTLMLAARERL